MTGGEGGQRVPLRNWPTLDELVRRQLREAGNADDGYPRACRHVLANGPTSPATAARLCIPHPADGLGCDQCHSAHVVGQHVEEIEYQCDGCGRIAERIEPGLVPAALGAVVRGLDGGIDWVRRTTRLACSFVRRTGLSL
jgi:hypothetical protein